MFGPLIVKGQAFKRRLLYRNAIQFHFLLLRLVAQEKPI